jgi:hypothetical protein
LSDALPIDGFVRLAVPLSMAIPLLISGLQARTVQSPLVISLALTQISQPLLWARSPPADQQAVFTPAAAIYTVAHSARARLGNRNSLVPTQRLRLRLMSFAITRALRRITSSLSTMQESR